MLEHGLKPELKWHRKNIVSQTYQFPYLPIIFLISCTAADYYKEVWIKLGLLASDDNVFMIKNFAITLSASF